MTHLDVYKRQSLYNTEDDSKPVFPLSSRDSMWFEFHSLGVALGINENLTAHVARHTFGVNMLTSGISMAVSSTHLTLFDYGAKLKR